MIKSILYIICLFLCPFQFSIWSVIQGFIYIYIFFFSILYHKTKGLGGSMIAKSLQSCPTLCDPMDGSPPGSPIPGILQARTLEWVAISFSNAWKWKVKVKSLSHVRPSATPGLQPSRLLCPWDFPDENTGMGCHFLLQGIFPTQGSNLLHLCTGRQILCH